MGMYTWYRKSQPSKVKEGCEEEVKKTIEEFAESYDDWKPFNIEQGYLQMAGIDDVRFYGYGYIEPYLDELAPYLEDGWYEFEYEDSLYFRIIYKEGIMYRVIGDIVYDESKMERVFEEG